MTRKDVHRRARVSASVLDSQCLVSFLWAMESVAYERYPPSDGDDSMWKYVPTGDGHTVRYNIRDPPTTDSPDWYVYNAKITCPAYCRGYRYGYWSRDSGDSDRLVRRKVPSYDAICEIADISELLLGHPEYVGMRRCTKADNMLTAFALDLRQTARVFPSRANYERVLAEDNIGAVESAIRRLKTPPSGVLAHLSRLRTLAAQLAFVV